MSKPRIDLTGRKYGEITVIRFDETSPKGRYLWICECVCGNITSVDRSSLSGGKTTSCGHKLGRSNKVDVQGSIFERLTVIKDTGKRKHSKVVWLCACQCGVETEVLSVDLLSGRKTQCGTCDSAEKEYLTKYKAYNSWGAMKSRCDNENNTHYSYYGGRGITYCKEWTSFTNFFRDMGERPEGMSLERIDPNGNYCKENCTWTSRSIQSFNTNIQKNNTSGKTGVYWSNKDMAWMARIWFKGETIRLGSFKSYEQAVEVREDAEIKYFGFNKP